MRTTHCQPLLASMLLLAGYQPNLLAEHILKRGEAEILGYKLSKTAFLSCDQETISIQHDDVISKAPGTRKCSNGPGPILAQAEILHVNEFEKTVTVKCGSKTQEIDVSDVTNFKDVLKELKPGTKIPVKTIKGHPYELNFQEPQLHPQRGDVKPAIEPPSEGTNRVNINHSARDGSQGIRPHGNPATDSVPSDARQLTNRPPLNPSP